MMASSFATSDAEIVPEPSRSTNSNICAEVRAQS